MQATSTWKFGQQQNLAEVALPALVVLLEVGSITTASIFFAARSKGLRVRALLLLAVTAGLGGAGGVIAYGWAVGVPVAVLMLGLVEIVGAFRHEQQSKTPAPVAVPGVPEPVAAPPAEPEPDTVEPESDTVDEVPDPFDQVPIGPVHDRPLTLVDDLRARPVLPTVRGLMGELGMTRHQAHKALTEARSGLSVVAS
mgnify:CR=1 FL=1